jgi:hypothetical protein
LHHAKPRQPLDIQIPQPTNPTFNTLNLIMINATESLIQLIGGKQHEPKLCNILKSASQLLQLMAGLANSKETA